MSSCTIDGCGRPLEKWHTLYCSMHRLRIRKHGDPHYVRPETSYLTHSGYRGLSGYIGHPLATRQGQLLEHRLVLFDAIGYGPHLCHWCRCHVGWRTNLDADHVDRDKLNNAPTNLVPSCRSCNVKRRFSKEG